MSIWGKHPKEPFSIKPITSLVALQLFGMRTIVDANLPKFAKDGFFIGYLAGGSNEFRRIANAYEDAFSVGKALVEDVFGDDAAIAKSAVDSYGVLVAIGVAASKGEEVRVNELMDQFGTQTDEVLKFNAGLEAGIGEIAEFMRSGKHPCLLADYVRKNYG